MKLLRLVSLITFLTVAGLVSSCSSTLKAYDDAAGSHNGTNGGESGDGNGSNGGNGGAAAIILGDGGANATYGTEASCGNTEVAAELTPVYMVFVYDKSASMGVNSVPNAKGVIVTTDNTEQRWNPVKAGMLDFFANAKTTNVQASLAFFAYPGSKEVTCAHDYSVPDVAMTSLETPEKLVDALNAMVPEGGTPTLPAVVGGIKYAQDLLAKHPRSEAIVVLVTDGEPAIYNSVTKKIEDDCAPAGVKLTNTIDDIAKYVGDAYAGLPSIKTYVIGIGSVASLETIAAKGTGNSKDGFLLIDPTDATATRTAILNKLSAIQPKKIDCSIELPAKAAQFDNDQVNVDFVHGDGSIDMLRQTDAKCTKDGWHYDDDKEPKFIELCESTCNDIQKDLDGKLKVVLGCPTRVEIL
jgi:hypothetical protein